MLPTAKPRKSPSFDYPMRNKWEARRKDLKENSKSAVETKHRDASFNTTSEILSFGFLTFWNVVNSNGNRQDGTDLGVL